MGFLDWFTKRGNRTTPQARWLEIDDFGRFYHLFVNGDNSNFRFCNEQAYSIAKNLLEVYNPIDIIAERVSSAEFFIKNAKGERVDIESLPTNLSRLVNKPNPLQNLQALIYNIVFSELASGASYLYPVFATKAQSTELISSIYCIEPTNITANYKRRVDDSFLIKNLSELVDYWNVTHFNTKKIDADKIKVFVDNVFDFDKMEVQSPLIATGRNIDNLIAVYSARYNVYVKNGASGLLARKQAPDADMQQFYQDGEMRQKMINEMNNTDGIIGHKNFIAISSVPLEFIKTLGTIQELEPFAETEADALAILGVYGVSPFLTPQSKNTTFTNQADAEKALWQNHIIPRAKEMCNKLNEIYFLKDYTFDVDFSAVQVLQTSRSEEVETDLKEIELYKQLKELGIDNKEILSKWEN